MSTSILISEFISPQALQFLREKHEVIYDPELYKDPLKIKESIQHVQGLIVRNLTQVNEDILSAAPHLKVVGRLGVGLENIQLPACAQRNIKVIPATGANAQSVAEYVIGSVIALSRRFEQATQLTLEGKWPRSTFSGQAECAGKYLGIIGFGSIGKVLAKNANGLGLRCIAYDPFLSGSEIAMGDFSVPLMPLQDLLGKSDYVSLHLPLLPETKNLFNAATLDLMKEGAILINAARGGILDENALAERLRSGRIGGAAIDVFSAEPAKDLSHFSNIENLILTPHIAGVTAESNERVSQLIANEVSHFLEKN
jgi:(S)-sulfolactate dehydrogenase